MRKLKLLGRVFFTVGILYFTACDNALKNAPDLEDSMELFTGLELIPEAQNSLLRINQGSDLRKDGYFTIQVSNVLPNSIIKNTELEAWCLEWTKSLRSDNDVHENVRWFSTTESEKWKPINYLFSIRKDLENTYKNLSHKEIQAVIWTLAGYMGIAPEFNIDKLSVSQLPSRLLSNG